MKIKPGDRVKCMNGPWGLVKEVRYKILIVKVNRLDEEWDIELVERVAN